MDIIDSEIGSMTLLHGIRENVTWHAKMLQMMFLKYKKGRLELVFGSNFCQLYLYVFTNC